MPDHDDITNEDTFDEDNTDGPRETTDEWVERTYQRLKQFLRVTEPVGSDETGWIVETTIDFPPEDLRQQLLEVVDTRETMAVLLTKTLILYTLERASAEAGAQRGPQEDP